MACLPLCGIACVLGQTVRAGFTARAYHSFALPQVLRLDGEADELHLAFFNFSGPVDDVSGDEEIAHSPYGRPRQPVFGPATVTLETRAGTIIFELEYIPQYSQGNERGCWPSGHARRCGQCSSHTSSCLTKHSFCVGVGLA